MVINDRHQFIFVHIPKTAGTSMMAALGSLPGNNRRWLADHTKHETLAQFHVHWKQRRSLWDRFRSRSPLAYRTFAFVRNPWDRLSSLYRYLKEHRPDEKIDTVNSFADFLEQAADGVEWIRRRHAMRPQTEYFTLANDSGPSSLRLGYLGHFEYLAEDVADAARRLGIQIHLDRKNKSTNAQRDYRSEYSARMFEIVGNLFPLDVERFGYVPDERLPMKRYSGPIDQRC